MVTLRVVGDDVSTISKSASFSLWSGTIRRGVVTSGFICDPGLVTARVQR